MHGLTDCVRAERKEGAEGSLNAARLQSRFGGDLAYKDRNPAPVRIGLVPGLDPTIDQQFADS